VNRALEGNDFLTLYCGSAIRGCLAVFTVIVFSGCTGVQSALDPAGREADKIARLFWIMTVGSIIVWLGVIGLLVYSVRTRAESFTRRKARMMIVGGGVVVPGVVLTVLLLYGLAPIPAMLAPAPPGSLRIAVSGEQWWWRVHYLPPGQAPIPLANEIRLPVGEPVEFHLESPDVIHSFWIPPLGGKMDMIPGRKTRLVLTPSRTGVFRGACAEYCGASHALMAFSVVVQEREDFAAWLTHQSKPAEPPQEALATHGAQLFLANGCSACHTIRGTAAAGVVGPDLTHVGSRLSLGAGTLPNDPNAFERWIQQTHAVKPDVLMPAFHMLPAEETRALAAYLEGLK
jgi:cytochrome c oxidase subunit 2